MKRKVVKRSYDASSRQAAAERTRASILEVARTRFLAHGYAKTTMADVARDAEIALDTVYASVGTKQVLFRLLIETAISGTDRVVSAEDRNYVLAIHAEPDARRKLRIYARALGSIHGRLAPLLNVLKEAAAGDDELVKLWEGISERRAKNMQRFAAELLATGQLRGDVDVQEAADVIWATNAPEFYLLLVSERGWSKAKFETWLAEAWIRLLVREEVQPEPPR